MYHSIPVVRTSFGEQATEFVFYRDHLGPALNPKRLASQNIRGQDLDGGRAWMLSTVWGDRMSPNASLDGLTMMKVPLGETAGSSIRRRSWPRPG
jgi:hypothetical protein